MVVVLLYGSSLMIKYDRKCHLPTLTPGKREGNFIRNRDNKLRKRGRIEGKLEEGIMLGKQVNRTDIPS